MAEKLNISIADANIVQAKLWDNPQISIGGMNLWSTKSQREEMTFPGSFAKHTQFTAELSQIISVSGRRAKLANMERVSKEIEIQRFEAILKGVKLELKTLISEISYQ